MNEIDIPQLKFQSLEITQDSPVGAAPSPKPKKKIRFRRPKFNKKIVIGVFGVTAVIVLLLVIFAVLPAISLYNKAKEVQVSAMGLKDSVAAQDIQRVKTSLTDLKVKMEDLQGAYKRLSWVGSVPLVGPYWHDGDSGLEAGILGMEAAEELVVTVEPYADIIGFTGGATQAQSGEDTANDRIEFLIQTLSSIAPKLDSISQKAQAAKKELDTIDPNRYPEEFRGIKVREELTNGLKLVDEVTTLITDGKPMIEAAPYLLGIDSPRTYLVLFQNDKELRPTGGFLTAYSIMKVDKGKVSPVSSSDIYSLDAKYKPQVPATDEMRKYLKGPYTLQKNYFLRDLNWNPDFKASMELFSNEAQKAGVKNIDGIIAVDTHVVVKILDVLGEIGVPGFGNFSTKIDPRCDCPQVIYELESFADVEGPVVWSQNTGEIVFAPANYGKNRKEIVGPLMNSVLGNALGQPKEKLPDLMTAGLDSLLEKHVLMYMFDPKIQAAVESFGAGGTLEQTQGDYFHLSNANLGGRKSNLYVSDEVQQDVDIASDGSVEKTVTITYKNPKEYDGWLNSVLPNWARIYVPKGSELISVEGLENTIDPYEENGKTVFAGGFELRPQGVVKVVVKYKLPFKVKDEYDLLIQKQPGTDAPLYSVNVGRQSEEMFLKTDQKLNFKI
jgi:hypothetical protein